MACAAPGTMADRRTATAAGAGATTSGAGAGACALDAILRVVLASFLLLVGFFASFLAAGLRLTFLAGLCNCGGAGDGLA